MIDCLADHQKDIGVYTTLQQCLLVCKAWSQKVQKYRNSTISITSIHQLLQYTKVVHQNDTSRCILVQSLSVDTMQRMQLRPWPKICSIIGTILLLIPKLPNLQKLSIFCNWHNDYHPTLLKLPSNMSVKVLHCTFELFTHTIGSILEFINHFQGIHCLSLAISETYNNPLNGSPLKPRNRPFQRAFPKTKICLKELHLDIVNDEIFKLVVNAFMGAKDFASHIHKYSCGYYSDKYKYNIENYSNADQEFLLHCSRSLQVLGDKYDSNFIQGKS